MGRIEEIKNGLIARYRKNGKIGTIIFNDDEDIEIVTDNLEQYIDRHSEFEIVNVEKLLTRLQIAEEQLSKIKDKAQIIASHCAVQMDRGGNVGSSYAFEKTQEIYEMLGQTLEQIQNE